MYSRLALTVFTVALLTGCGDSIGVDITPVGTYQLESINSAPLPQTLVGVTVLSGTVTLGNDNSYTLQTVVRSTDPESGELVDRTESTSGSWTRFSSTVLQFTPTDVSGSPLDAVYDGRSLTVDMGQFVAVYRR